MSEEKKARIETHYIKHTNCFECGSVDNNAVYAGETEQGETVFTSFCHGAGCRKKLNFFQFKNSEHAAEFYDGDTPLMFIPKEPKERINMQSANTLFAKTVDHKTEDYPTYRGIRSDTMKFFGHRIAIDENRDIFQVFYPETRDNKLFGFKCRTLPKSFEYGNVGLTGGQNDLSGQDKFKGGGKYVMIVGGENDKAAAYQMLRDYQVSRGQESYDPVAVVAATAGEGSTANQISRSYDWLDTFDVIIMGLDNDEAGEEATKTALEMLPKDKVKIATWSGGDPHAMLESDKAKQFLSDFYKAREVVKSGILKSTQLQELIAEEVLKTRITLPPYMHRLQAMSRGGFLQGRMVNVIGMTSVGKSSHVNGMAYHWMMLPDIKPGIVSAEATAAQYSLEMLGIHLSVNFDLMKGQEILDFLERPDIALRIDNLWKNEYGEERFVILDERDGNISMLQDRMDRMVKHDGCNLILVDVLSDILRGNSIESQEDHMKYQKSLLKQGVTIVNVLHTKKIYPDPKGKVRKATEYDALGTSSFIQSAAYNIVINRDKMTDDNVMKNTTEVDFPKCRGGMTGPAGGWYYDSKTRECYDKEDWSGKQSVDIEGPPVVESSDDKETNKEHIFA